MIQKSAKPIMKFARFIPISLRLRNGYASTAAQKKKTAAGKTYEGFTTWVERLSVHGAVNNQHQTSQRGRVGKRLVQYQQKKQRPANDSRLRKIYGVSGMGRRRSGNPTTSPCKAPG